MTDHPAPTPPPADTSPDRLHARVTGQVVGWVADALRIVAMGERVTWDAMFQLANSPGGPVPTIVVFLQIPSAIIGQPIGQVFALPLEQATEQTVRAHVGEVVGNLFASRLRGALPTAPGGNGHPLSRRN